jgi:RimJ/RimL family protein N-acetyltransferase
MTPLLHEHLGSWQQLLDDTRIDRDWLERELRASDARFAAGSAGIFLVWLRAGGELVGFVGLRSDHEPARLELTVAIAASHGRQGLATEASTTLIEHVFALGHEAIYASCDEPDTAARHLCERLGFTLETAAQGRLYFRLPR